MDVSDFFVCSGEGRGSPRRQEGAKVGFLFFMKIPGGGGSLRGWGAGEGVCGEFGGRA